MMGLAPCPNCHRVFNGQDDVCSMLCNQQLRLLNLMRQRISADWPVDMFSRFMLQVALDRGCITPVEGLGDLEGSFPACPARAFVLRTRLRQSMVELSGKQSRQGLLNHALKYHGLGTIKGTSYSKHAAVPEVVLL